MKKLQAVIFDWAGTTVDYGCMAPTGVFIEVFRLKGIEITNEEARGPMGMHKRDHIREVSKMKRVNDLWNQKYGHSCTEEEISEMFESFIPLQMAIIEKHSDLIPEVPGAVKVIRDMGLKIGSTTGYNNAMMEIVTKSGAAQGYEPDAWVCAADVPAGRPAPWMAFRNAEMLGVYPMETIVKIGDTVADIQEGLNAGMWSVGVISSSNEMGLPLNELNALDKQELTSRKKQVREKYLQAGAHYVIDTLDETGDLLQAINERLARGEKP